MTKRDPIEDLRRAAARAVETDQMLRAIGEEAEKPVPLTIEKIEAGAALFGAKYGMRFTGGVLDGAQPCKEGETRFARINYTLSAISGTVFGGFSAFFVKGTAMAVNSGDVRPAVFCGVFAAFTAAAAGLTSYAFYSKGRESNRLAKSLPTTRQIRAYDRS